MAELAAFSNAHPPIIRYFIGVGRWRQERHLIELQLSFRVNRMWASSRVDVCIVYITYNFSGRSERHLAVNSVANVLRAVVNLSTSTLAEE